MAFAVLFDLDGLLVDSERVQQMSFNAVLQRHGIHLDEEAFSKLVGISTRQNFIDLKKRFGFDESLESIIARKNEAYQSLVPSEMRPIPGAMKLVNALANAGFPMAVASSSPRADVVAPLKVVGLDLLLPRIVAGDEVVHTKPAPDLYLKAASLLGIDPQDCVALEDTESGLGAAVAAGIPCVVVPNRFTRHHDFTGAAVVVKSLTDVTLDLFRSLQGVR